MRIHNIIGTKLKRSELRNHLTPAEATLWNYLKNNQLSVKFRRQHCVGPYILDFYCPSKKLGVELDGSPHDTPEGFQKDREREEYLKKLGIQIVRFENKEVFRNLDGVLVEIKKYL